MILIFSHQPKMPIRAQYRRNTEEFSTKPDFKDLPEWDVF